MRKPTVTTTVLTVYRTEAAKKTVLLKVVTI
jgi:hypothetical protein